MVFSSWSLRYRIGAGYGNPRREMTMTIARNVEDAIIRVKIAITSSLEIGRANIPRRE